MWNGKKAKIAFDILKNPRNMGGLGLVNLRKKEMALKATWPQILKLKADYAEGVYSVLKCSGLKENIWRCNLDPEDIQSLKIKNKFWEDILFSWCSFNYNRNFRVQNQVVWYHSRIRVKNRPFFWKDLFDNGLLYLRQIF